MNAYVACLDCKKGKIEDPEEQITTSFAFEHGDHNLRLVPEADFLSDFLEKGFIDVDRPDAKPIKLHMRGEAPKEAQPMPFGAPGVAVRATTRTVPEIYRRRGFRPAVHSDLMVSTIIEQPIRMRPTWDETFLQVARVLALRGTCSRKQVGAVLVFENRIISTGYNGAPAGLPHCRHENVAKGQRDPDMEGSHCARAEHAERNAIIFAGREARGGTMYVTCSPCLACCRMMVTAGIARIVYGESYRADWRVEELCGQAGIDLRYHESGAGGGA